MSTGSEVSWTTSQKQAVEHLEGALLVSAAAGSGKTAVLAARCAYLVCDAPEPCDVDQLLVLTFTRAAAAEMKERIDSAIRKRAEAPDASERILRQLRLIDRASITTIDAFCGQLVREHFHLVGVDPGFAVLAPEDASLLRNDVASELIEAEFDAPGRDIFQALLDGYFRSDADRLRAALLSGHALSQSIVDPAAWMDATMNRLSKAAGDGESELLQRFGTIQQRAIQSAISRLAQIANTAESREGLAKYAAHVHELHRELTEWLTLSTAGDFDTLAARVKAFKLPRLPAVSKDTAGKEAVQREIDRVKDRLKKGELNRLVRWTRQQLRDDVGRLLPLAARYFDLLRRFDEGYRRAKRALRSMDFADVEASALRVLRDGENPSPTARAIQARFRHVLVDEFQDINPLQYALLRFVSRDRAAELDRSVPSNLFSVGDVKQSIYRFRLAEPQQFIDRRESLCDPAKTLGKVIDLQENFRSRTALLEAINDVFRCLMTRESTGIHYDATHELKSLRDYAPVESPFFAGKPIELHLLPRESNAFGSDDDAESNDEPAELDSFEREVAFIAERIRKLVEVERPNVTVKDAGVTKVRPARYGDVVVLLRSARFKSSQVADALRARGMPVHSDDATGFFNAVEVQDVLSVLRVLSNARQDVPMAAVLRSPFFDLPAKEDSLAGIRIAFPDEPFHRAVVRYAGEKQDELAIRLAAILRQLAVWRRMFRERPVGASLRELLEFNGFDTFCRARDDGAQRFANLKELRSRGEAFDAFERQGLDRFLAFLEELQVNDELGRPSLGAESDDVVRVMTIHKSKGLEFPIVVIPDLGKRFNTASLGEPVLLDRDLGIGMTAVDLRRRIRYPSVSSIVVREHARRQAVAEEVRVLYVALTRAREHLILVGTAREGALAGWQEDWSGHTGPLPDDIIQGAGTPLDWLGPIAAVTDRAGLGTFKVVDHSQTLQLEREEEKRAESGPSDAVPETEVGQPVELRDPVAKLAIERITYTYPHHAATKQRATMPVTEFVAAALPTVRPPRPRELTLEWPAAFKPRARASAVEVGTATHLLLQLLDFHQAQDVDAVRKQATHFVDRRLISAESARLVDIDSIVWLLGTPLGALMKRPDVRVQREQSLAVALPALGLRETETSDRRDRVLVRGRVDVLVDAPEGLTLIDYKSDRLAREAVNERAARYAPQLWGYAEALQTIAGRPVAGAYLVFLQPRVVFEVPIGADEGV